MLLLSGCASPPPDDGRHEAVAPIAPGPVKPPPPRTLRAAWKFDSSQNECVAVAAAGSTSLRVTVRDEAPIRLVVVLAPVFTDTPAVVPLHFTGPAGNWQITARRAGRNTLGVSLSDNNAALSRVLVLLSGGTLEIGAPPHIIVTFAISPSDTNGQNWFDCARQKAF